MEATVTKMDPDRDEVHCLLTGSAKEKIKGMRSIFSVHLVRVCCCSFCLFVLSPSGPSLAPSTHKEKKCTSASFGLELAMPAPHAVQENINLPSVMSELKGFPRLCLCLLDALQRIHKYSDEKQVGLGFVVCLLFSPSLLPFFTLLV